MPGSIHEPLLRGVRATRIEGAIRRGGMIEAIRLHLEATDSSLAEANDAVDAMASERPRAPLEQQGPRLRRTGCLTAIVAVVAA